MAAHSIAQSHDFPPDIPTRVALVEKQQEADHGAIADIGRKIDRMTYGLIAVLLAVISQLIFKH